MDFILKRVHSDVINGTFGTMAIKGQPPFCVTVEKPDLNNSPGKSCIPAGEYPLKITMSNRLQKMTPELLNVPGRTGIRIHTANLQEQLEGCIAPGETFTGINGKPGVGMSADAFKELMNKIHGEDSTITIERCY